MAEELAKEIWLYVMEMHGCDVDIEDIKNIVDSSLIMESPNG